jgi:hypothetical protein
MRFLSNGDFIESLNIQKFAQVCFIVACISGLCIGSGASSEPSLISILASLSQLSFIFTLLLVPFFLKKIIENIKAHWTLWALALLPLIHLGAYTSSESLEKADGIFLISVCGIVLGHALPLEKLLSTFFFCCRLTFALAVLYTLLFFDSSFTITAGLPLWKSFLPSANSLAVIIGAIAIDFYSQKSSLSKLHRTSLLTSLAACIFLTQNISICIALLVVFFIENYHRLHGMTLRRLIFFSALLVTTYILFFGKNILSLLLLHGRLIQWHYFLRHFDSMWFGLGAGNIQKQPFAIDFQKRFLDTQLSLQGDINVYIDNGYLNLFFDYGILGIILFALLIRKTLHSFYSSLECDLLKNFLLYLSLINITGGWLLYSFSPWWLIVLSTTTALVIKKYHNVPQQL